MSLLISHYNMLKTRDNLNEVVRDDTGGNFGRTSMSLKLQAHAMPAKRIRLCGVAPRMKICLYNNLLRKNFRY